MIKNIILIFGVLSLLGLKADTFEKELSDLETLEEKNYLKRKYR